MDQSTEGQLRVDINGTVRVIGGEAAPDSGPGKGAGKDTLRVRIRAPGKDA